MMNIMYRNLSRAIRAEKEGEENGIPPITDKRWKDTVIGMMLPGYTEERILREGREIIEQKNKEGIDSMKRLEEFFNKYSKK